MSMELLAQLKQELYDAAKQFAQAVRKGIDAADQGLLSEAEADSFTKLSISIVLHVQQDHAELETVSPEFRDQLLESIQSRSADELGEIMDEWIGLLRGEGSDKDNPYDDLIT